MATTVNERLAALTAAGTSVWLDQIRRSLVEGGELERMVREESLRGVTSNPAIFEKAILGSPDYDEELEQAAREGLSAREVYRRLAVRDVQLAADVMRPVWEETGGADGFVSLEVAPRLAHDTEGTLEQARMYWGLVDRPNLMVKIPGTDAGVPAIEQAVYEGINVNVTLLFSVESYARVAEAFIRGLERRQAEGESLEVHSVASFFVSRVDSEVDKRLEALERTELQGRAGVANARNAYRRFKEIFHGARFETLRQAGAHVQRPLWASTGVKNPLYRDTMYVEMLVGPDTVNTMPLPTLMAMAEHGEVTGPTVEEDPTPDLEALRDAGIDLDDVTDKLLREGIDAFMVPMAKLLAGIETRRQQVLSARPTGIQGSLPGDLAAAIGERMRQAAQEDVARRLWHKDESLWGGGPEIANRLGWLTISEVLLDDADNLEALARECAQDGLRDAVLLGMGGSSLAPEVLRRSQAPGEDALTLHVLDSTDPQAIRDVEGRIDLEKTLFIVSTKSGGTIETRSLYEYFRSRLEPSLGTDTGSRFVAITDPGTSLADLAAERGFRRCFLNDPDIGGRYSALSYFGMVPAALMGVDIRALLESAQVAEQACQAYDSSTSNSGLWLGVALGELALRGRDKLTFVVSPPIEAFGLWAEQLVAESTGKHGKGILPVADEPLGEPDAYGDDRVFVYLRNRDEPDQDLDARVRILTDAGHPTLALDVGRVEDLGRIFFFAEFATAVAGWVLGINPFDQPDVQAAKDATDRVLNAFAEQGRLSEAPDADDDALRALLGQLAPGRYLAIMGYVAPSEAFDGAVAELRALVRDRTKATTTFGYGPRFLHSTGQLHKGGPPAGAFLQLLHDAGDDIDVPDAGYGFNTLKAAQAAGDLETLRSRGLPAERITLAGADPAAALVDLTSKLKELL